MHAVTTPINGFIWTYIRFYLVLDAEWIFTVSAKFMPLRLIGNMARITFDTRANARPSWQFRRRVHRGGDRSFAYTSILANSACSEINLIAILCLIPSALRIPAD